MQPMINGWALAFETWSNNYLSAVKESNVSQDQKYFAINKFDDNFAHMIQGHYLERGLLRTTHTRRVLCKEF